MYFLDCLCENITHFYFSHFIRNNLFQFLRLHELTINCQCIRRTLFSFHNFLLIAQSNSLRKWTVFYNINFFTFFVDPRTFWWAFHLKIGFVLERHLVISCIFSTLRLLLWKPTFVNWIFNQGFLMFFSTNLWYQRLLILFLFLIFIDFFNLKSSNRNELTLSFLSTSFIQVFLRFSLVPVVVLGNFHRIKVFIQANTFMEDWLSYGLIFLFMKHGLLCLLDES